MADSMLSVFLTALFFTLLGLAYVKGYDLVKRRSPEHLVHFYLIMATIRMLLTMTVIGLYVMLTPDRDAAIHFSVLCMAMYLLMMVVTLSLRH